MISVETKVTATKNGNEKSFTAVVEMTSIHTALRMWADKISGRIVGNKVYGRLDGALVIIEVSHAA